MPQVEETVEYDKVKALTRARELISDPTHWIKGRAMVWTGSEEQGTGHWNFCLVGALDQALREQLWTEISVFERPDNRIGVNEIRGRKADDKRRVMGNAFEDVARPVRDCIRTTTGNEWWNIPDYNDYGDTKHEDVLGVLDCAIEVVSGQEAG